MKTSNEKELKAKPKHWIALLDDNLRRCFEAVRWSFPTVFRSEEQQISLHWGNELLRKILAAAKTVLANSENDCPPGSLHRRCHPAAKLVREWQNLLHATKNYQPRMPASSTFGRLEGCLRDAYSWNQEGRWDVADEKDSFILLNMRIAEPCASHTGTRFLKLVRFLICKGEFVKRRISRIWSSTTWWLNLSCAPATKYSASRTWCPAYDLCLDR